MNDDPLIGLVKGSRQEEDDDPLFGLIKTDAGRTRGTMDNVQSIQTAVLSGIPGIEAATGAMGAVTGFLATPGGFRERLEGARRMYQPFRRALARSQEESKETLGALPYEAIRLAPEIAASFTPLGGANWLRRAAFSGGVEAIRGASRAGMEREQAPDAGEVLRTTVRQGALGALFSAGAEGAMGLAGRTAGWLGQKSGLANTLGPAVQGARRSAATMLESPTAGPLRRALARAIEPADATMAERLARKRLPVTDETAGMIGLEATAARSAAREAEELAGREAADVLRMAREQTGEVGRQARRTARFAVETERRGGRDAIQQARQQAQAVIEEARGAVAGALPTRRTVDVDALRNSIRARQLKDGKQSYDEAFRLAGIIPTERVRPLVDREIGRNAVVKRAYDEANRALETPDGMLPDLRALDRMRQAVSDFVQSRQGNVGISRTQARDAWAAIDRMEQAYLNVIPEEAGMALKTARAQYRDRFKELEALQAGRNLSRFGVGKAEGLIQGNRLQLAALERELAQMTPQAREYFQKGASQWVNDQIDRAPQNVVQFARQLVGTPERARRASLALGDEAVQRLQAAVTQRLSAPRISEVVVGARETAAGRVRQAQEMAREFGETTSALNREQLADAQRLAEEIRGRAEPFRQRAQSLAEAQQAARMGVEAIGSRDAGLTLEAALRDMSPEVQRRMQGVMATNVLGDISQLTVREALPLIRQLRQAPGTRRVLGDALAQVERDLALRTGRGRRVLSVGASAFGAGLPNIER